MPTALAALVLCTALPTVQAPDAARPGAARLFARLEFPTANLGEAKPTGVVAVDLDGDGRDELIGTTRGPGSLQLWSGLAATLAPCSEPRVLPLGDYPLGPVFYGGSRADRPAPKKLIAVAPRAQPAELLIIDPAALLRGAEPAVVRRIPQARRPRVLTAGNLLADAEPELAVVTIDDELCVYGAGDTPRKFPLGDSLARCALLLEDGGGIVVGFQGTRRVVLWKAARGSGGAFTLTRGPSAVLGGLPRDLDELDLDGDGDRELIVAGGDGQLWIFGKGAPGGVEAGLRAPPESTPTAAIPIDLEHRSVDGGEHELCALSLAGMRWSLYRAGRAGLGASEPRYAGQAPVDACYGDFDGDGRADLAIANTDAGRVSVLFSDGAQGFQIAAFSDTGRAPISLATGDLDGDKFPELLVLDAGDGALSIAKNERGQLGRAVRQTLARDADLLRTGDLDGDGRLEAAYLLKTEHDCRLVVLFGEQGQLFERAAVPPRVLGQSRGDLLLHDADADGRLDVLASDPDGNRVLWLRNESGPSKELAFAAPVECAAPSGPRGLAVLDAPSEIAVALNGPGERTGVAILRLEQDAGGVHALREILSIDTVLPPLSIAAADLDGLGRRDLAVLIAEKGPDTKCFVVPCLRQADGTFTVQERLPVGYRPYRIAAGDLDRDGRAEILVSAQNSHHVEMWTNTSASSCLFRRTADLGVHAGCLDILLADLDTDGWPEVLVANGFSNDVGVVRVR